MLWTVTFGWKKKIYLIVLFWPLVVCVGGKEGRQTDRQKDYGIGRYIASLTYTLTENVCYWFFCKSQKWCFLIEVWFWCIEIHQSRIIICDFMIEWHSSQYNAKVSSKLQVTVKTDVKYLCQMQEFLSDAVIFYSDRVLNKFTTVSTFCSATTDKFFFCFGRLTPTESWFFEPLSGSKLNWPLCGISNLGSV